MPIHDDDLHRPGNRYLTVREDATLREAFALLVAPEVNGAPWWVLLVRTGSDRWAGRRFDALFELTRERPEILDLPLQRLGSSDDGQPRILPSLHAVERPELSLGEAEDLARTSPEGLLVVCDHGRLAGVFSASPTRSATGPTRFQLEELAEGVRAPLELIEDRAARDDRAPPESAALERRFTDISCPRRVWLGAGRVSLVLCLTLDKPELSRVEASLTTKADGEVLVELFAPGFEILNAQRQEVRLPAGQDSPPLVFHLHPLSPGHHRLTLEFFQGSEPLGAVDVPVEVTETPVAADHGRRDGAWLVQDAALPPPDIVLRAVRRVSPEGETLTFTLIRRGGVHWQDFQPMPLIKEPRLLAQGLLRHVQSASGAAELEGEVATAVGEPGDAERRLEKAGQWLWRELIPEDLKRIYSEERETWRGRTLVILSDEPYIPWELMWPYGKDWKDPEPWCLSLRLSRWLRRDGKSASNTGAPGRLPIDSFACIAPGDSGLPGAGRERLRLTEMLGRFGIADVTPDRCTWGSVMALLEHGDYSWFHTAAHGDFDRSDVGREALLHLEGGETLAASHVVGPSIEKHIADVRPVFVFNACHAGRLGWGLTDLAGWANHLVSLGAAMVLGPLWAVRDDTAVALSETFYEALLSGATVAEALRRARRAAHRNGDPSWLAYSLHAHPNARIGLPPRSVTRAPEAAGRPSDGLT